MTFLGMMTLVWAANGTGLLDLVRVIVEGCVKDAFLIVGEVGVL